MSGQQQVWRYGDSLDLLKHECDGPVDKLCPLAYRLVIAGVADIILGRLLRLHVLLNLAPALFAAAAALLCSTPSPPPLSSRPELEKSLSILAATSLADQSTTANVMIWPIVPKQILHNPAETQA